MGMNYLLDTHVLLWWVFDDPKLCSESREIIKNSKHQIFVSSASAWEIATKYRIGKMCDKAFFTGVFEIIPALRS